MGWRWCTLKTRSLCLEVFKCKLMCFHRTRPTRMTLASFQLSSYRDKFANSGISKNLLVADIQFRLWKIMRRKRKDIRTSARQMTDCYGDRRNVSRYYLFHIFCFFFLFKREFGGETFISSLKVQFFTSHAIAEPVYSYRRSVVAAS